MVQFFHFVLEFLFASLFLFCVGNHIHDRLQGGTLILDLVLQASTTWERGTPTNLRTYISLQLNDQQISKSIHNDRH